MLREISQTEGNQGSNVFFHIWKLQQGKGKVGGWEDTIEREAQWSRK